MGFGYGLGESRIHAFKKSEQQESDRDACRSEY